MALNINNISGHLNSTADTFIFANNASGGLFGTLLVVALFFLVLFVNIQVDGFKKRLVFASLSTFVISILFFMIGILSGFMMTLFLIMSIMGLVFQVFFD